MSHNFDLYLKENLKALREAGLYKTERQILGPQSKKISLTEGSYINLCANNYLGLANNAELIEAAKEGLASHGLGLASVRFICGTQDIHSDLEQRLAQFLGLDDSILFAACFDANAAVFEPLLGEDDAIISDSLNHASIIDGVRLCKAKRYRYKNSDMEDLRSQLIQARSDGARHILIVTDGVFSMDGYIAKLPEIVALAKEYDALTMVDDCHGVGVIGQGGRGTPSHLGVEVDIITGTFGKALGGAMGGYIASSRTIVEMLRQKARPYLFSNSLAPALVFAAKRAIDLVEGADDLRGQLNSNVVFWRKGLRDLGFNVLDGDHPIVPIMLGEAKLAQNMAATLGELGVFVTGFFYPVVPMNGARIRTQLNADLSQEDLSICLEKFKEAGKKCGAL